MSNETEEKQKQPVETTESAAPVQAEAEQAEVEQAGPETDLKTGELLRKLDEATAEIQIQKERYLRTVADLENYRKRSLREKEEARRQANCNLLEDLLPVLDNFRLGLKSAEQHEGGAVFAEGFRMILTQMESALRSNGLEEIRPEGAAFDPNFHECVAHLPNGSVPEGHVIEVQRVGYRIQERLLRPAIVIVSSGAPAEPEGQS